MTIRSLLPRTLTGLLVAGLAVLALATSAQAATFVVTNTNDSGAGSLRQAIVDANNTPGKDLISFNIPGAGVKTIVLQSELPEIAQGVVIDGLSQPGAGCAGGLAGNPTLLVELDGSSAGALASGLTLSGGDSAISGLIINRFGQAGILIEGDGENVLACNFIGTNPDGTLAQGNKIGVAIDGSSDNRIGLVLGATILGNLVSGNGEAGIRIRIAFDSPADANLIRANRIGSNLAGTDSLGHQLTGISVEGDNNIIGGSRAAGMGNLIAGNLDTQVHLVRDLFIGTTGNRVQGNDLFKLPGPNNSDYGIRIVDAPGNLVGGDSADLGNHLVGNYTNIEIERDGADGNEIAHNLIGVFANGPAAGSHTGIYIRGADDTLIRDNLISGHTGNGIEIDALLGNNPGRFSVETTIVRNTIGLNAARTQALSNQNGTVLSAAVDTQIGDAQQGNVIAGNQQSGILLLSNTTGTVIRGNSIGTNGNDSTTHGNYIGIYATGKVEQSIIGGTEAGQGNQISGNKAYGIYLTGSGEGLVKDTAVQGNYIGVTSTGAAALSNGYDGILLSIAGDNLIGGDTPSAGNLVSGNGEHGIRLGSAASDNRLIGNVVGLNAAGTAAVPNLFSGIGLQPSDAQALVANNRIHNNLVGGNRENGILLNGVNVQRNLITGNRIGVDAGGLLAIPNSQDGIHLDESSLNTIGGTGDGDGNLIGGNTRHGVYLFKTEAANNTIQGNSIGLNLAGNPLGNGGDGVRFESSGPNLLGGTGPGMGNTIAHNGGNGVSNRVVTQVSTGKAFLGNAIYANAGPGIDLFQIGDGNDVQTGVTPNDPQDPDTGPNNYQNYPVPIAATNSGANDLSIAATFNSTPNTTFRVEWFGSDICDASGHGEGQRYLGFTEVTTDGAGDAAIAVILPNQAQPLNAVLTATATDPGNNTSEFSACVAINAKPFAIDDFAVTQQNTAVLIDVLANDFDPNGDALTIASVTNPANGTAVIQGGKVLYTPAPGFIGLDSFSYSVDDGKGGTDSALATVAVLPPGQGVDNEGVNDAPVAIDDQSATLVNTPVGIGVLNNDFDPDGDVISIIAISAPAHGAVQNFGGVLLYTPNPNYVGGDTFTYAISDPDGLSDSATVTVTVSAKPVDNPGVNDAPVAVDDLAATPLNTPIAVAVLSNDFDPDGDPLSVILVSVPANGTAVIQNNQVVYTPANGFAGADSFTYVISDGNGGFDIATVFVSADIPDPTAEQVVQQPGAQTRYHLPMLGR